MKTQWLLEALGVASFTSLSAAAAVRGSIPQEDVHVQRNSRRDSNAIAVTSNYVSLRAVPKLAPDGSPKAGRRDLTDPPAGYPFNAGLTNVQDIYYVTDIKVGNQTLPVSIDTGSSDTWFIKSPFTCINNNNMPMPEAKCGFDEGFIGNFSHGTIPGSRFSRQYADGTFVTGYFGFDDVTLGGVAIQHQQLAMVNQTYWYGDGKTSGLLGLAYPLMTSIDGSVAMYDPVFTTMWKTEQILPLFTIALSRDDEGRNLTTAAGDESSYLAFGGLPPVDYDDSTWARTPIQTMGAMPSWNVDEKGHGLYVITADAYIYGRVNASDPESTAGFTVNTTQFPILVDSGSTLTILPTDLATAILKSFYPPAQFLQSDGAWYAPCNAKMARFGVRIGTQETYWMSADDLLRPGARDKETGHLCRVGIMDSDSGPHVLGVTFLSNVVAVFDVGNTEMRFAKRLAY